MRATIMEAKDFYNISQFPVPAHLLTLPVRSAGEGPGCRFAYKDWGFDDHPRHWVDKAIAGDHDAKTLVDRALDLFIELMRRDVRSFYKLNPVNGTEMRNERGEKIPEMRSQWIEAEGTERQVNAGNPVLPHDHYINYVRANWHHILSNLSWFDPEPSHDPDSPHTQRLVDRKMAPGNPERENALVFMAEHGLKLSAQERAHLEKARKLPAKKEPAPQPQLQTVGGQF